MFFNTILQVVLLAFAYSVLANSENYTQSNSVYEFSANDIHGNNVSLAKYKGYPLIIVNVASNCGLTETNYEQLNQLYKTYQSRGLRILAFPCNQFLEQEPGTNEEIAEFAKKHDVKFDMFAKIDVNGETAHPLYKFLKLKQPGNNKNDSSIEWNFAKFIIDKEGKVVERFVPKAEPLKLIPSIEKYL